MNAYRGSTTGGGPSKATAATLCQKCLKRGHYSYECKAVAQERPYVSRPSRTQQLFNPKLVPKLTSDVPQDLLRKKGIADEVLAKAELERGRKRERQSEEPETTIASKRLRSASSGSSSSVSTISTKASRSRSSQFRTNLPDPAAARSLRDIPPAAESERKRRRRSYSYSSSEDYTSDDKSSRRDRRTSSRSTRRKIGDSSPPTRGRRRSRTPSRERHSTYSSDGSRSPVRAADDRYVGADLKPSRNRSRSPGTRQRPTRSPDTSSSRYKSVNERRDGHPGPMSRKNENERGGYGNEGRQSRILTRERSLSPFSRRVALTQSMNMGR